VVIEEGVLIFHADHLVFGSNIYVGHQAILKGYHRNEMRIGSGTWIGQQCFLHSAGGIEIGANVGIGPGVRILSSQHRLTNPAIPILHEEIETAKVTIGDGSDVGVSAVILPGVTLGVGVQVGAGAVVTRSFPDHSVIAGVPAVLVRNRSASKQLEKGL
jgi:acetyltransferase-like isoleucine patch superfamily enzyme